MKFAPLALVCAGLIAAPAAALDRAQTTPRAVDTARAVIKDASGAVLGEAKLSDAGRGVLVRLELKGLKPGWHGVHFHEKGACSDAKFTSAGGHVHGVTPPVHGLLNPTANDSGDLPNIYVDEQGRLRAEVASQFVVLKGGSQIALLDPDGAAIVIHANPDDHASQPIGGAGDRVACGVIE